MDTAWTFWRYSSGGKHWTRAGQVASISRLPSGKWRARVRVNGVYRGKSFATRKQAATWAATVEGLVESASATGLSAVPKTATVSDLLTKYTETVPNRWGRTKTASLRMLERELGSARLAALNAGHLRDFIDRRQKQGAGGVTIAGDLSILAVVLKWARSARQLDLDPRLALDARASLQHRGLSTRSQERDREPTDAELALLYAYWAGKPRMKNDMPTVCSFLLATAMRLGEVCGLRVEDIDPSVPSVIIRDRKDPRRKKGTTRPFPCCPKPGRSPSVYVVIGKRGNSSQGSHLSQPVQHLPEPAKPAASRICTCTT